MIIPGSTKVAEFKTGVFDDLQLPEEWTPLSLAVNRNGKLFCLVQHGGRFLQGQNEWKKRWAISLGPERWEVPVLIPDQGCDRLEFDSQDRLWALGKGPRVGFLADDKWTTFTYSDDQQLHFLPLRLIEDATGRVVLFAHDDSPGGARETSRLVGALIYAGGRFVREPSASTAAFSVAESRRYAEPIDRPGFDRAHGFVCHAPALNVGYRGPKTALETGGRVFISLGNAGLLWADAPKLAASPPLSGDEWEPLNDITVPPTLDAIGSLWVGRGKQLLKISLTGAEAAAGELPAIVDGTIDFDPLGRPWVMLWHGSIEKTVTICDRGVLRSYPTFPAALRGEAAAFAPGRIFAFALKTPGGLIATGGAFFDLFAIIDGKGRHPFTSRQISRAPEPRHIGHGYNPFRNGEPWFDAAGRIYTRVDGLLHVYDSARRSWSPVKDGSEPASALPPLPAERNEFAGPFRGELQSADHRRIVFKGFHFFAVTQTGEQQLDSGVNPLAFYPFWSGWHGSPGTTTPRVDPIGRLWISALGPYAQNQQWLVLRKPAR